MAGGLARRSARALISAAAADRDGGERARHRGARCGSSVYIGVTFWRSARTLRGRCRIAGLEMALSDLMVACR
jgi:hypothetical protein